MKGKTGLAAAALAAASVALGASEFDGVRSPERSKGEDVGPVAREEPRAVAMFYADLGPDELDVSAYPERQRKNYEVFTQVCSQCHSAARPLWSPVKDKGDWERYVRRMKARTANRSGTEILKADAEAIVEFLVYDSKLRKVEAAETFDKKVAELRARFERLVAERKRRGVESDRRKAKPQAPFTGTRP